MTTNSEEGCAYCGSSIAVEKWHPVALRYDEDGGVELYDFCSAACKEQWECDAAGP